ncbi:MAG: hypothetical protein Ct9H90mP1_2440 [Methanobacteriota archaeon]|nr:MAG: hypothetical protein Ct9H90mP1_2440 [Euryarchaeota archaeon]
MPLPPRTSWAACGTLETLREVGVIPPLKYGPLVRRRPGKMYFGAGATPSIAPLPKGGPDVKAPFPWWNPSGVLSHGLHYCIEEHLLWNGVIPAFVPLSPDLLAFPRSKRTILPSPLLCLHPPEQSLAVVDNPSSRRQA